MAWLDSVGAWGGGGSSVDETAGWTQDFHNSSTPLDPKNLEASWDVGRSGKA